jgi:hypothetical protein
VDRVSGGVQPSGRVTLRGVTPYCLQSARCHCQKKSPARDWQSSASLFDIDNVECRRPDTLERGTTCERSGAAHDYTNGLPIMNVSDIDRNVTIGIYDASWNFEAVATNCSSLPCSGILQK